jgi:hypothetical protein
MTSPAKSSPQHQKKSSRSQAGKPTTSAARESAIEKRKEARRRDTIAGAYYALTEKERQFVVAIVAGASESDAAISAGYRADRAVLGSVALLRKTIVRAAIYDLRTRGVAGVEPAATPELTTAEINRIALMPDDLLQDRPTYGQKLKALELKAKLEGKLQSKNALGQGGAEVVRLLVESARRRHGVTVDVVPETVDVPRISGST